MGSNPMTFRIGRVGTLLAAAFVFSTACSLPLVHAAAPKRDAPTNEIVLSDRRVEITDTIKMSSIKKAQSTLLELDAESDLPIWLLINSGGGSVEAGLILIDTFRALRSPIYCLVESKAYSMAAIMMVFCERRYALTHASIMLHEASYGTVGEDPSNRSRLDFLARYLDVLHEQIAARVKMPLEKYRAKIRDGWWMLADEAKKAGVINDIVEKISFRKVVKEQTEDKTTVTVKETRTTVPADLGGEPIPKRRD